MYEKDKTYNLKYLDGDGKEQTLELTPEDNMSTPQVINYIKDKDNNFFKLLENKLIKESNKMEEVKTLYDLIIERDEGIDICDVEYDMCVYVDFTKDSADSFDVFVSNVCKQLHCVSYDDRIATVDLYKWVDANFKLLDELFDTNGENEDEEKEELICDTMPALFSGYASDSTYNDLNSKLGYNKAEECNVVEEDKEQLNEWKELKPAE